jgi:predicted permease
MSTSILPIVQIQLTRYVMPIILIIGNIGNIFIVILFSRHRKNACSLYLICAAVMNFGFIGYIIPMGVYSLTYGDPGSYSLIFCKLRQYLLHIYSQLAK